MRVDILDILAVIFGVWFTIRKLDAQSREASGFPHVASEAFHDWRKREVAVYQLASLGCFLKVVLDLGFTFLVAEHLPFNVARVVSGAIDLSWIVLLLVTAVRSTRVRTLRSKLGIYLGARPGPGAWEPRSDEDDSETDPDEEDLRDDK